MTVQELINDLIALNDPEKEIYNSEGYPIEEVEHNGNCIVLIHGDDDGS